MLKYVCIFIAITLLDIFTMVVYAATIKNADLKTQSLIIAEGSTRSNISLNTNQVMTVCIKGCFITFPNKDHFAIKAADSIEINDGKVFFK
ncbi:hypothetical protein [Bartonella sp. CB189]|uniref:hypothetical protein n=1 Tax=Bartonella sp. CB189 TaxID=3112254 RepID=UPI002F96DC22